MPDPASDNQSQTPTRPLSPDSGEQISAPGPDHPADSAPAGIESDSAPGDETKANIPAAPQSPDKGDWRMPVKTARTYKEGDIVDKVYRLGKPLGSGGMGVVFACEHMELKQQYAMKILADASVSQENWKRFQLEAKALARLHHPSIVGIHNMGVDQGEYPYYVMDLLDGETLESMVRRNGRLPVNEALQIFIQLASALDQAHAAGIIHRDIKPANIIMVKDLRNSSTTARLVDFGIARLSPKSGSTYSDQHQTASGLIFGTPIYMSPEQSTGKHVDQRSDIYSLGCALVESLTAFPPFKGDSAFATILKHQTMAPPTLLSLAPNGHFNDSLESLVQKMLAKNPVDRYQSMSQVGVDMTRILKGKSILSSGLTAATYKPVDLPEANRPVVSDPRKSSEARNTGDTRQSQDARKSPGKNESSVSGRQRLIDEETPEVPLHYKPPHIETKEPQQQKEDLVKQIFIAATACIALVLIGLAAVAIIVTKPKSSPTAVQDLVGDNESEFQVVAKLLRHNPSLCKVEQNAQGKMVRTFTFPDNHYIGYMQIDDGEPFQAMGTIEVPAEQMVTLHLQGLCMPFPEICKQLGNDNVNDLEIITERPSDVIKYLREWTALKKLSFYNSLVHKDDYDESVMTDNDVLQLDQLKNLESIGICDPRVTGQAVLHLNLLKSINSLKLKGISNQRVVLEALPQYANIKELCLVNKFTTDRDMEILAKDPYIERLKIYHSSITPASLSALSKMHNLKSVSLSCDWPDNLKKLAIRTVPGCEFIDYEKSSIY